MIYCLDFELFLQSTTNKATHKALENIRRKNINRLIFAELKYKSESVEHIANKNTDVLLISETKIDSSFPSAQFHLEGYATPCRLDRNANGGDILLYIREDSFKVTKY